MRPVLRSRAFTLIELLLVIIIMGLVYSFVGNSFVKQQKSRTITLQKLPKAVRTFGVETAQFRLFGRECDKYIWLNGSGTESITVEDSIKINRKLKVYNFDMYGELREVDFGTFRLENRDHKICFEYHLYRNGSTSSYIVEDEKAEKFYLFKPLKREPEEFKSLQDAKEVYLGRDLNPKY